MLFMTACPVEFPQYLHDNLKEKIAEVAWLDVNDKPREVYNECLYVIRYYPCSLIAAHKIDMMTPQLINARALYYRLENMSDHYAIEGYCAVNINLRIIS